MSLGPRINDAILAMVTLEHRVDPLFRDAFNKLLQRPLTNLTQALMRIAHHNPETRLGQELPVAGEAELEAMIATQMENYTRREYQGRIAERAGNTKTYGVVSAQFEVLEDIPSQLRKGVFSEVREFPAWIRFGGPGPASPPDVADAGILSIAIKLMDVPGAKLLDDEAGTQDFLGISSPTFTTPNVTENLKLQRHIFARTPVFYFLNPLDSHLLDLIMQSLYARMNRSPLEVRYWSCVPYLCGEGRAIKYSIRPVSDHKTSIPWNPPDDWLRQSMGMRLGQEDVILEFGVQQQTDPRRMPIEDASIEWPERLSPFIPVARIRIPRQRFQSLERSVFARKLSYNPWHAVADHRPLGNQNRARLLIYSQLSQLRQSMNHEPHFEPDGSEVFPEYGDEGIESL